LKYEQSVIPGEIYEFSFRKLTEASWQGFMELGELNFSGGKILASEKEKKNVCGRKYKMLSIGDSITCAYGVDGDSQYCPFTTSTEDVRHGYAFLVAKEIQADIQTVAWSGKGVVRNYGDANQMSPDPFPIYYNRTIAVTEAPTKNDNYWYPAKYSPDFITVMLGTNDYSTEPAPSDEQYTTGLTNFINQIQLDYPKAKVAAMCSPMSKNTRQCPNIESVTKATNIFYIDIPESVFTGGYGCDWHPNQQTQRNMADYIIPFAKDILGEK
jgi:lysophospholipase L1-like esterase